MKGRMAMVLLAAVVLTALLPSVAVAHHMGRGLGSAPDVVDNYAHGANAASGDATGSDWDPSDPDMSPPTGDDTDRNGGPTEDGVNGPQEDIPGGSDVTGGPNGGSDM